MQILINEIDDKIAKYEALHTDTVKWLNSNTATDFMSAVQHSAISERLNTFLTAKNELKNIRNKLIALTVKTEVSNGTI